MFLIHTPCAIYPHFTLIIEKLFKFIFFRLCVRLTILQIGTHLKIVLNRYHSHQYNTTDCFFFFLCVRPKKYQIGTFLTI